MTEGLFCVYTFPLAWRVAQLDPLTRRNRLRAATLLLNALNQMESTHELETAVPESRRLDRIEAKLDLTLHLLARALATADQPAGRVVRLNPAGAGWPDPAPPAEGSALIVELHLSETLPLSLELPAIALAPESGNARIQFDDLPEALAEALYQFVFRRHRQAIRARGGQPDENFQRDGV